MNKFTIWFNAGLSTLGNFVSKMTDDLKLMKFNKPLSIIVSSQTALNTLFSQKFNNENVTGFKRTLEPAITDNYEYLDYCINFCKKNNITHFVAYKKAEFLCQHRNDFENINVKFISDADNITFNSKILSTDFFNNICRNYPELNIAYIPYFKFNNAEEFQKQFICFKESFSKFSKNFGYDENPKSFEFAVKPDMSINAQGFKHILDNNKIHGISNIYDYCNSTECTYDSLYNILELSNINTPFICTPFFQGDEWSIDCLKINDTVISIPRKKAGRFTYIQFSENLMKFSEITAANANLQGVYNIQLKTLTINGTTMIYPLEINTRMAGGAYKSAMISYLAGFFARKILDDNISNDEIVNHIDSLKACSLVDVETSFLLDKVKY